MGSHISAGMDVGISSARVGCTTVVIVGGGGGVERPEGELRMRRRCLSDVVRGTVGSGACIGVGVTWGGGGNGRIGGGFGGTSNAGGIVSPCEKLERGTLSTLVLRLCERVAGAVLGWPSFACHKFWPWAGAG